MNKLKFFMVLFGMFFLVGSWILYIVRGNSYDIKTEGKLYIVNKLGSSITSFDLNQGKELFEYPIEVEPHEVVAFNGENKVVVTNYGDLKTNGQSITVIDTKNNKLEKEISLEGSLRPHGIIAFPETDKVGVVTDSGNELIIINVKTGVIEKKIPTLQNVSHLLVKHPKKPIVFVTNINSNSVSVIDLDLGKVVRIISCGSGTEGIDITPDGSEVWVVNKFDDTINIINTASLKIIKTINTGKESMRLKFSIDGKSCLVTNSTDGTISVYDQKSKKEIKKIAIRGKKTFLERLLYHTPRPLGILMHPNGLYSFVSNTNADEVEVIDMRTMAIVSTIGTGRLPDGLTLVQ